LNLLVSLNSRIRASHPDHAAIVRGLAWVSFFVLLGKLSGAVKEMAVAWRFGVSPEVDAYLFVLNLLNWPLALWFSVLTMVLVPLAARLRTTAPEKLPVFRSELLGAAIALGLLLALVAAVVVPAFAGSTHAGLPAATAAMARQAAPGLLLLLPLGTLTAVFSVWMLSAGRHANTLLEGVPAIAIAAAVTLQGGGMRSLVIGTVAGAALQMACLAWLLRKTRSIEAPRLSFTSPAWSWFRQGFLIMLAGNALMSLSDIIDVMFSARMEAGSVAILSYANRVLALLLGLGGTAISRTTLPVFANARHRADGAIHAIASRWVGIMFGCGLAAAAGVWLLAAPAIRLLFQRGAFDAANTEAVAEVLRYGALQLPFYFAALVMVTSLVARDCYRVIAIGAALNLLVKLAANMLLVPAMGLKGIVLGSAFMYLGSFAMLFIAASRMHRKGDGPK
jgi:peptidoglycan biosynthesis protein MviN/MurJ (putative lipid II flippase)